KLQTMSFVRYIDDPFSADMFFTNPFYDPMFDLSLPFSTLATNALPLTVFDYNDFDYYNDDRYSDRGQKKRDRNRGENWERNKRFDQAPERNSKHINSKITNEREGAVWRPTSDLFETRDAFIVHIDLPVSSQPSKKP
ncbi:12935_t:CDS:2, partial [Acaulospora colombiana]